MSDFPELEIVKGSGDEVRVRVVDANDEAENLSTNDGLSFAFTTEVGVAPIVSLREGANLTADGGDIVWQPDAADLASIPAGRYLGEAAVRFGSADDWRTTKRFFVDVIEGTADKT